MDGRAATATAFSISAAISGKDTVRCARARLAGRPRPEKPGVNVVVYCEENVNIWCLRMGKGEEQLVNLVPTVNPGSPIPPNGGEIPYPGLSLSPRSGSMMDTVHVFDTFTLTSQLRNFGLHAALRSRDLL